MKITRPGDVQSSPGRRPAASRIAQEKARERAITPYVNLECGHKTNWDDQQVYEVFRPKGKAKYFCERCGKWVCHLARKPAAELPPEPMF